METPCWSWSVILAILFTVFISGFGFPTEIPPAPMQSISDIRDIGSAMEFLDHYGYLNTHLNGLMGEDTIRASIREFQRFSHLTETGAMDEATVEMMNSPRCGLPDVDSTTSGGRQKRYYAHSQWDKTDLTYDIIQYTPDLPQSKVDSEIAKAFKLWSDVTALTFSRVHGDDTADIKISFPAPFIPHEDGYWKTTFDGPGKVLAHAFFPSNYGDIKGDAHFDDGENWTADTYEGTNLWLVAAHEFGHSLGLAHSDVIGSLMYPYYSGYKPNFQLTSDDIAGMQSLYGAKVPEPDITTTAPKPDPNLNPGPRLCPDNVDAITATKDGHTYAFQGDYFWRLQDKNVEQGYPKRISDYWSGLDGDFDAVFTSSNPWFWGSKGLTGKTWFFKDSRVWRFQNMVMDPGYPRLINDEFRGLPTHIDAVFEYYGNGQTYFFKDGYFYMLNWRMEVVGPFYMTTWRGIPDNIDAVYQESDQYVYFFKDNLYYKFEHDIFQTLAGYPRSSSADWFLCNV
ncbi:stromelysin-3-like [Saccoglossus kowalevskii]|uniref:Matrix metalloproteinase-14-like n=1 Tax=Saccoglossus kowalevskii TaxID=10224 RepID=A0ABM0GZT4_SACKO|nr:PREDICTED: matrix metalloproteinase-14-like [Saccoglossus kowalevskii]